MIRDLPNLSFPKHYSNVLGKVRVWEESRSRGQIYHRNKKESANEMVSFILAIGGVFATLASAASLTQVPNYNNNATSKAQM